MPARNAVPSGDYGYVECRALGHAWDQIPSTRRPEWGYLMTFRCTRCAMVREDNIMYGSGFLDHRNYRRPEGYTVKGGPDGAPRRSDWRLRLIDKHQDLTTRGARKPRKPTRKDQR